MSDERKAATEPIGEGVPLPDAVEKRPEQDYYGQLLRLKAEFENYRKRVDRDRPEWLKSGRVEVVAKFLPLYDLLQHAHDEVRAGHADTPLAKGLEAVFREFEKVFKEEGVTPIDAQGKPFDPHYHEAFGFVDKQGIEEGAVAEVLQAGYMLGDKVLRPARVRLQKKSKPS